MPTSPEPISIAEALSSASVTRALVLGTGVLNQVRPLFETHFGNQPVLVVADPTTFSLAGAEVEKQFETLPHLRPYIFPEEVYAEHEYVLGLEHYLKQHDCVPIAVGSGVVNDLTKLAAHRAGRPYLCCATAASMDGYTAFGASITLNGSKQTFNCPAPVAVLAPLEIISRAPPEMTASGYADLAAKIPAGADWLLADALDVEPLNARAWRIVQSGLRRALSNPAELRTGSTEALSLLTEGLMLGGFAMQWLKSSRPASGAEHQFSHLWDMQRHTHDGRAPSHGFKVAIGSLAAIALYESLLQSPIERLDIDAAVLQWPTEADCETPARLVFSSPDLRELASQELRAKWVSHETLRHQLTLLKDRWPELREKLGAQLVPYVDFKDMLQSAGAPVEPEQIGIPRARLRESFWQAYCIRRRFTVLDLAVRTGLLEPCLAQIFGTKGVWPLNANVRQTSMGGGAR